MKDTEMRGLVLQKFYEVRRQGTAGIRTHGVVPLDVPSLSPDDVLEICDQLGDHNLIEWRPAKDERGKPWSGTGRITAFGIDLIEGKDKSPIAIQIAQSLQVQQVSISGQQGGEQVAGDDSARYQSITQDIERLVRAINGSTVSDAERADAKSKLAAFLQTSAAGGIVGGDTAALVKLCSE